jgi:hypothetical protein
MVKIIKPSTYTSLVTVQCNIYNVAHYTGNSANDALA